MSEDIMRQMCIDQGYVPAKCVLLGGVILMLVKQGEDPCAGCNLDRTICAGRPKKLEVDP